MLLQLVRLQDQQQTLSTSLPLLKETIQIRKNSSKLYLLIPLGNKKLNLYELSFFFLDKFIENEIY
jgi:uncharacterized membrane protein